MRKIASVYLCIALCVELDAQTLLGAVLSEPADAGRLDSFLKVAYNLENPRTKVIMIGETKIHEIEFG